jgi:hypothetical protein
MKVVVVYESMYGNTHLVADAIARGLRDGGADVDVVPVADANAKVVDAVDLVVVGGPTHVHGMSRPRTREAAVEAANKPGSELVVDRDAEGPGLREWFDEIGAIDARAAAFDTRIDAAAALTGRASKGIVKRLRAGGCTLVVEPRSFLVSKDTHLLDHEEAHAREWGVELASAMRRVSPSIRQ